MRSWLRLVLPACLALGIVAPALLAQPGASVQGAAPRVATEPEAVFLADASDNPVHVPAPAAQPRTQSASITVNYNGFTDEAKTAFQAAVDIWNTKLSSSVPIEVDANWTPQASEILGSAGATRLYSDFPGAPMPNTFYKVALANKLAGRDLDPARADITANFNSTQPAWYYGTDGNTPRGKYDLMTVVLHELGHGLGFSGSASVSGGSGQWGVGNTGNPQIYDRYVVNGAGQLLINTALFPNPSSALAAQYQGQGGGLFWDGPAGKAANGGDRPKLYSPSAWEQGSSYSHLDQNTYSAQPNGLMRPGLTSGTAIHDPGPIMLGMFADIGWFTEPSNPTPTATSSAPSPTPMPVKDVRTANVNIKRQ